MANKTKATVQGAVIRASLAVVNVQAGVVVQIPVAAIAQVTLHVDAMLDVHGLHFNLNDSFALTDLLDISFGKVLDDSFELTDSLPQIGTGKGLADSVVLTDALTIVAQFQRVFADDFVLTDSAQLGVDKVLEDSFALSDSAQLGTGKFLADSYALSDSSPQMGMGKVLADTVVLADSGSLHLQTYATDYVDTGYVGVATNF